MHQPLFAFIPEYIEAQMVYWTSKRSLLIYELHPNKEKQMPDVYKACLKFFSAIYANGVKRNGAVQSMRYREERRIKCSGYARVRRCAFIIVILFSILLHIIIKLPARSYFTVGIDHPSSY